jgi:hypothetical protein
MDKEKMDIEAKALGCRVVDYALYKHKNNENMILSYVYIVLFAVVMYLVGFLAGSQFLR